MRHQNLEGTLLLEDILLTELRDSVIKFSEFHWPMAIITLLACRTGESVVSWGMRCLLSFDVARWHSQSLCGIED